MKREPNTLVADEPSDPEISIGELGALLGSIGAAADEKTDHGLVGERFGKYLIVGEVAVGGMAEVFLGVHRGLEGFLKVVVIKRVLPQFSSTSEFVRMFIDEARLAARLDHQNIVRTYEFGEVDGQYFTTMEYLPGEDLCKALNKVAGSHKSLPIQAAVAIVSRVCAGLHFAHQLTDTSGRPLNLVHRDVNPANIVITYGGEVKIIDFGVAKTSEGAQTVSGTIKGKIAYMAPEQLLARGVDQRSDVFSTGVVLWELLTGRPLFIRDSEAATLYAIMNDPIPVPSRYRPEIPAELDRIVMRALARTPVDRYDTAEEMADALDTFARKHTPYDSRALGRFLVDVFGRERAEAKLAIAQTRSLRQNISLVMKLRSEVRTDLAGRMESLAAGSEPGEPAAVVAEPPPAPRRATAIVAATLLLGVAAAIVYVTQSSGLFAQTKPASAGTAQAASLVLDSTPQGAAISLGGEPTGLVTPATLTGITASQVEVRLELAGHEPLTETVAVAAGAPVSKAFSLAKTEISSVMFEELPRGSIIYIDGEQHASQPMKVKAGPHDIRIVFEGETIAQQSLVIAAGDQRWTLVGDKLMAATQ